MKKGKYNIKAVSTLTGIQPGTLRAWERRYKILEPIRNQAGHRLYTDEHIRMLKWLAEKVQQGLTISQAAFLLEQSDASVPDSFTQPPPLNQQDVLKEELLQALLYFDEKKAQKLVNKAFALFTIKHAAVEILASLLAEIHKQWEKEKITKAQKHFAFSVLRERMSMAMHSFSCNSALPKVAAAGGPGEQHEHNVLVFALFARQLGCEVIDLGPDLNEQEACAALDIIQPKFLFLSCTFPEHIMPTIMLAQNVKKTYPHLEIGIGGAALNTAFSEKEKQFNAGATLEEWENWINSRL